MVLLQDAGLRGGVSRVWGGTLQLAYEGLSRTNFFDERPRAYSSVKILLN